MISGDFTIDLATWSLTQRMAQAQVAAENIARSNSVGGAPKVGNFEELISSMASAVNSADISMAKEVMGRPVELRDSEQNSIAIDKEVADLSSAQGGYKAIAKAISLKMALMTLASNGGK